MPALLAHKQSHRTSQASSGRRASPQARISPTKERDWQISFKIRHAHVLEAIWEGLQMAGQDLKDRWDYWLFSPPSPQTQLIHRPKNNISWILEEEWGSCPGLYAQPSSFWVHSQPSDGFSFSHDFDETEHSRLGFWRNGWRNKHPCKSISQSSSCAIQIIPITLNKVYQVTVPAVQSFNFQYLQMVERNKEQLDTGFGKQVTG